MKEISWKPDRESDIPLYEQIKRFIREKIANGEWYLGYQLPPQRDLAVMLGVNRSTLKYAVEDLTADGILATKGRGGTVVNNNTWSLLGKTSIPWKKYLQSGSLYPNKSITQKIHNYEFDTDMIRLSTGELSPSLFPHKDLNKAMQNISAEGYNLNYSHPNGIFELREEIAAYYQKNGMKIKPSQIMIISGGLQAIHLISIGLLPKGASICCEKPSYLYSLNIFESMDIHLRGIKFKNGNMDLKNLEGMHQKIKTKICYLIPYYQNPTGLSIDDENRRALLAFCRDNRLPLVEDDSYRELYYDGKKHLPLKAFDENQSIIHVGSVSKTLCAGLRIGWIIGQEEVVSKLADLKMQIDYGASTISQLILLYLLKSGRYEKNIDVLRKQLKEKRDFMLSILERDFSDCACWTKPEGGFYVWLNLNIKDKVDMNGIFEYCRKHGVLINPGYMYDADNNNGIRLSFAYEEKEGIEKGLGVLRSAICEVIGQ